MVVRIDPENNEIRSLLDLVDLTGKRVLEIGSGDGRLTWRYARLATHVTAVEPFSESIRKAKGNLPFELRDRIEFHKSSFLDFAAVSKPSVYDVAILSWSL
jgi:2-polyprenyl-3-methyl-5-hydroxy-6-metoxy-1,4-benzoquinol methylase